jgi:predicted RND superfamily exporter protein
VITEELKGNSDLLVYYGGVYCFPRIFHLVKEDLFSACFSLVLVFVFMWFQIGSLFLAVAGALGILSSFAVSLAFWKALGQPAFTLMQGLSIYVILGVGCDDYFVFSDAGKQSLKQSARVSGSAQTRFQWSWSKSVHAMIITSFTTAGGFFMVATSEIPTVWSFGVLAGVLVLVAFAMAITWFPACVLIHHKYVVQAQGGYFASHCFGCLLPICTQWKAPVAVSNPSAETEYPGHAQDTAIQTSRVSESFFSKVWYPLLLLRVVRIVILSIFGCMALAGVILAATRTKLSTMSYMV